MTSNKPQNMPDYQNIDYRGFAFAVHKVHGMLLLHCTRKAKKGPHFQLPGGHIDEYEFQYAAEKCGTGASANDVLLEAAKMGTARELFEETGIDMRGQLDRLDPVRLFSEDSGSYSGLPCMLQNKCYFSLNISDDDFPISDEGELKHPNDNNGYHLTLRISNEHSGYIFENDPKESIKKIDKHSGGTGGRALRISMNPTKIDRGMENDDVSNSRTSAIERGYKQSLDLAPAPKRHGIFSCFFC